MSKSEPQSKAQGCKGNYTGNVSYRNVPIRMELCEVKLTWFICITGYKHRMVLIYNTQGNYKFGILLYKFLWSRLNLHQVYNSKNVQDAISSLHYQSLSRRHLLMVQSSRLHELPIMSPLPARIGKKISLSLGLFVVNQKGKKKKNSLFQIN